MKMTQLTANYAGYFYSRWKIQRTITNPTINKMEFHEAMLVGLKFALAHTIFFGVFMLAKDIFQLGWALHQKRYRAAILARHNLKWDAIIIAAIVFGAILLGVDPIYTLKMQFSSLFQSLMPR